MFPGAVYQAVTMSKAFVVKKFLIKEATVYLIEVITYMCTHIPAHIINMITINLYPE